MPILFVFPARDRAVPARVAFFHDHGGQLCDAGRPAADARGGIPLSRLAGPASCHHLPPVADAVLHLVRKHLLHYRQNWPKSLSALTAQKIYGAYCTVSIQYLCGLNKTLAQSIVERCLQGRLPAVNSHLIRM